MIKQVDTRHLWYSHISENFFTDCAKSRKYSYRMSVIICKVELDIECQPTLEHICATEVVSPLRTNSSVISSSGRCSDQRRKQTNRRAGSTATSSTADSQDDNGRRHHSRAVDECITNQERRADIGGSGDGHGRMGEKRMRDEHR